MDPIGKGQDKAAWRKEQLADLKLVDKWCRRLLRLGAVLKIVSTISLDLQRHMPIDWIYIGIWAVIFAITFIPIQRLIREDKTSHKE